MDLIQFERERLALFARYGFAGESRWAIDDKGRPTYTLARGTGPCPTVLIHGGMSEASEWSLIAGKLSGDVLILDRPGCGLSYPIDYGQVADFRGAASRWLLEVVDHIGCTQIDLVGNSMGGYFGMAFALAHPSRVRRFIQVGAPPGLDRTRVPLFIRLLGQPVIGPLLGKMTTKDVAVFRKRVLTNLVARPDAVPADLIEMMMAAEDIPGTARTTHTMLRSWFTPRATRPHMMIRGDVEKLAVPTLFLWGDADSFIPSSIGREVAEAMPDARIQVVAGAGHVPYLEQPEIIASAIRAFLATS